MLKNNAVRFGLTFITLFVLFYYFNIGFFSITSEGTAHYNSFIDQHFNYISGLRALLLGCTALFLNGLGFKTITNNYELLVAGHGAISLVYSCLGLGIMSFFTAFVIAYPKPIRQKIYFFAVGLICIQLLNIIRMALIALFWGKKAQQIIDHHILFNGIIYLLIGIALYFWVTANDNKNHAKN